MRHNYFSFIGNMVSTKLRFLTALASLLLCLCADESFAATSTWNGNTSTDWCVGSNWSSGAIPTSATDVIIPTVPAGGRMPVSSGTAVPSCKTLTIQNGATLTISGTTNSSRISLYGNLTNNGTIVASGYTGGADAIQLCVSGNLSGSGNWNGNATQGGLGIYKCTATLTSAFAASSIYIYGNATTASKLDVNTQILSVTGRVMISYVASNLSNISLSTGTLTVGGDLTNGGLISVTSTGIINVAGNWTFSGTAGTFSCGTGTVNMNGASSKSITYPTIFNNLIINNAAGITLTSPASVGGTLSFSNGILSTTTVNILTLTNTSNAAVVTPSATKYVSGPMKWKLASGFAYSFPVGKGGTYYPFALTPTGVSPEIQVEAFNADCAGTADGTSLSSLSTTEYWYASVASGTYTTGVVGITRQDALGSFDGIGRCTTINGVYTSLGGSISGTSIINSASTGTDLGYLLMGVKNFCATPGIPGGLSGTGTGTTTATLSWLAGAPSGSAYYWALHDAAETVVQTGNTAGLTANLTGLACNTVYHFHVRAYASCNATYSGWSAASTDFATSPCVTCVGAVGTWLGCTSADWHTASNWGGGIVPIATTNVIIPTSPLGGRMPVSNSGTTTPQCKSLIVQSGAVLTITNSSPTVTTYPRILIHGDLTNNGAIISTGFTGGVDAIRIDAVSSISGSGSWTGGEANGGLGVSGCSATLATNFFAPCVEVLANGTLVIGNKTLTVAGDFLTVAVTSACTITTGTLTLGDDLLNSGSVSVTSAGFINVGGDWRNDGVFAEGTGTVTFVGPLGATSTVYSGGTGIGKQFYNLVVNADANTTTGSNDGNKVNLANSIRINHDFVLTTGYQFNCNTLDMSIGGNFTHNICEFNRGEGSVTLTGTSKLIDGSAATYFRLLNITGSYTLTEPEIFLWSWPGGTYGDLNIFPGGTLDATTKDIHIDGNWTNNGVFTSGTGTVIFEKVYDQTVFSGGSRFYNIEVNKSATAPFVTITDPAWVTNYGNFLLGIVNFSGTGSLTFVDNATSNGGAADSYVDGTVVKIGNEDFVFPVGDLTTQAAWQPHVWAPLKIANAMGVATDQFSTTYNYSDPGDNTSICSGTMHHASSVEFWELSRDAGVTFPPVTLYWKNGTRSGIVDPALLVGAHKSGACWDELSASINGIVAAGDLTFIPLAFSPFTFGTKTNDNPLPVSMLHFSAVCMGGEVVVQWSTASESNNDFFTIERSPDALQWQLVSTVQGSRNSNTIMNYEITDKESLVGTSYYRIAQTDLDGRSETFDVIAVSCDVDQPSVSFYPNPATSWLVADMVNVLSDRALIELFDQSGRKVFSRMLGHDEIASGKVELDIGFLAKGFYSIKFSTNGFNKTAKLAKD